MNHSRRITDRPRASIVRRVFAFAALLMLTGAVLALTGCALSPEARNRELAWQGLNIADGVQTSQYRQNDCREVGTWRYITGPEPSVERTVLAATINGALHFAITWALERYDAPSGIQNAWAYTTLGLTGGQVIHNARLGCE